MHWPGAATWAVICLFALGAGLAPPSLPVTGAAWADDGGDGGDGDGGDGDGDDGGGGSSASGGGGGGGARAGPGTGEGVSPRDVIRGVQRLFRGQPLQPQRPRRQAAPQPVPRPDRVPNEIVARGLSPEDTAALVAQGYALTQSVTLTSLATTVQRFDVPEGTTLEQARATVRALPTGEAADFNHYYRTGQATGADGPAVEDAPGCDGLHCPARTLINWPEGIGPGGCGAPVTIGIVDTGLNPEHEALNGAAIEVIRVAREDDPPSSAIHGTAVAAILVGNPGTRVPGLLPGLPVVAVDAFHKQAGDERADAFTLVQALDLLVQQRAGVINLSLAGPPNTVLRDTLAQITGQRGITVVAASGNAGPRAEPAYPAAYDNVIAVTAVDQGGTAYRRAGRGPHVDLAAQGVQVWTAASVEGARWKTGTSFAAPYVTAAAALWLQHDPALTPAQIADRLTASAVDLGPEGRDEIYGSGLLNLNGQCPGQAVLTPAAAK